MNIAKGEGRPGIYQRLVYAAYVFYIILGIITVVFSLLNKHSANILGLILIAVFCGQFYFKNLLGNLILGVILMFGSVFMAIESANWLIQRHEGAAFMYALPMVCSLLSLVCSGILIFSFMKLRDL